MNKYLFVGSFFTSEMEKEVIQCSRKSVQTAANKLQQLIINGVRANNIPFDFLTIPAISSFPLNYKKMLIHRSYDINGRFLIESLSFNNFILSKNNSIKKNIINFLKKHSDYSKILFYAFCPYTFKIFKWLKRKFPNKKIVLYLVDLPIHTGLQQGDSLLRKTIRQKKTRELFASQKYIDGYIFITRHMADYLRIKDKKITIINGMTRIADSRSISIDEKFLKMGKKRFVYTGAVTEQFGVVSLINQFTHIKRDDIELIICGNGNDYEKCISIAQNDKRIKLLGTVDNETAINYQLSAYALINPMKDNEGLSKYSFPSKMFEYLGSKALVIGYWLSCYDDEYRNHLIVVDETQEFGLEDAINFSLSLDKSEVIKIVKNINSFIDSKNNVCQTKKIGDFMEEV